MSVDWDRLGQPRFDRIIEALVRDRFGPKVRAVNGKGGDGGIDIEIVLEYNILWVLQLKYYETGFSSGFRGRRQEIKKSYTKAAQHNPSIWTLVVPCLCTTPEDTFVQGLNGGSMPPVINIVDRDELDVWLAEAPHIEAWVHRTANSELERLAKIFNQEKAALVGGVSDVLSRVRDLGGAITSLDPQWAVGFAYDADGSSSVSVQPRHPGAVVDNPITFAVGVGEISAELDTALKRSLGYATTDTVILPASVVRSVHISGGPFTTGSYPPGVVQIMTAPSGMARGKQFEITTFHEPDAPPQVFEGRVTHAAPGPIGGAIESEFCNGHLKMSLLIPHDLEAGSVDPGTAAGFNLAIDYGDTRPGIVAEVLSTARLIRLAKRIEIRVDGQLLAAAKLSQTKFDDDDVEMVAIEEFAGDLDVVQRHTRRYFDLPAEFSERDRVKTRVARLLAEGYIVAAPKARRLTMIMSGDDSPELRSQLARPVQPIVWPVGPYAEVFGGRELLIGDVYAVHPRASMVNANEAIAALDAGHAEGFQVFVEPVDEPFLYLTLADVNPDEVLKRYLAAWSLHGIDQPGLPSTLMDTE